MKKNTMMVLALVAMTAGAMAHAESTQDAAAAASKVQVSAVAAAEAAKLTTDEQAFAAKLSDQNRKSFSENLSVEQRKSVLTAFKNGADADEAVQIMLAAKEMKDAPAIADAEKATAVDMK